MTDRLSAYAVGLKPQQYSGPPSAKSKLGAEVLEQSPFKCFCANYDFDSPIGEESAATL